MVYRSSPYQRNIIYMTERYADTPIANIGGLDCYRRKISYDMAADIFQKMVELHPVMRLRLQKDGTFYLKPYEKIRIPYYDMKEYTEDEIIAMAEQWMKEIIPMYDHDLYDLRYIEGADRSYAFSKLHHVIGDGLTFVLMVKEEEQMQELLLAESEMKSREDFLSEVCAKAGRIEDNRYLKLLEDASYVPQKLRERAKKWYLSCAEFDQVSWKLKEAGQSPEALRVSYLPDAAWMQKITGFVKENGLFYETLIYGAVYSYIFIQKRTKTAAIGRVLANRTKKDMESYGLYANTLPLFISRRETETVKEFLKRIQNMLFEQQKYAGCDYEELADAMGFSEQMYDISISYRPKKLFPADMHNVGLELFNGCSEIPLRIFVDELDGQLHFTLQYQCSCYQREEIDAIYHRLYDLMEQLTRKEEVAELSAVTSEDKAFIHKAVDSKRITYQRSVLEVIEEQMQDNRNKTAVCMAQDKITYEELETRMYQCAYYLRNSGVQAGEIVSVCLDRSLWLSAVLLGIWKAGASFLTINTAESDTRKDTLSAVSSYCITEADIRHMEAIDALEAKRFMQAEQRSVLSEDDAYLMYTSGTSGIPKAAIISQKSLAIRLMWMLETYGCGENVLQKTPYTFDVSIWEIFLPLFAGKTSYMLRPQAERFPDEIGTVITQGKIDMLHFVPTMLQVFLKEAADHHKTYPDVKTMICSGEALSAPLVDQAYEIFPECTVVNLYGPTECTIDVLHHVCKKHEKKIPIGKPVYNTRAYIVNAEHKLLPAGVEGEICITGDLVGKGYYRMQSEAFGSFMGERAYDTGDYGMLGFDGNIYYCGRKDTQHKIRGMRIDLSALEDVLLMHEKIQRAAATVRNNRIEVCCLSEKEIPSLRLWLKKRLPPQQIPAKIYFFSTFPYNKNGKLDETLLWEKAIEQNRMAKAIDVSAQTEREEFLREIIADKLGMASLSVTQSFFEAGLDSLLIFEIVTGLREHGFVISYEDFYRCRNIRELAAGNRGREELLCCLHKGSSDTKKLFLGIPYAGGTPWLYAPLCRQNAFLDYDCYALSLNSCPKKKIEAVARETVKQLLALQEYEEYVLFGYCVGSALAIEIAARLEKSGRKVKLCIAASQIAHGIQVNRCIRSGWDLCNNYMLRKILSAMQGKNEIVSEEMAEQFRVDVRRFLEYFSRKKSLKVQGQCTLLFAKKDPFTGSHKKCRTDWAAFLNKEPSHIRVYEIENGGHFFLRKNSDQAAELISQIIKA